MTLAEARAEYRATHDLDAEAHWDPMWALWDARAAWSVQSLDGWMFLGAYLRGLLDREPVKSSARYEPVRTVLGALLGDCEIAISAQGEVPLGALGSNQDDLLLAQYLATAEARVAAESRLHRG